MEYWRGMMDWNLAADWACETCGARSLIWGLIHAQCRCMKCHTQYRMRDEDSNVVETPICQLKVEYKVPAQVGWKEKKTTISTWTKDEWEHFTELAHNLIQGKQ